MTWKNEVLYGGTQDKKKHTFIHAPKTHLPFNTDNSKWVESKI